MCKKSLPCGDIGQNACDPTGTPTCKNSLIISMQNIVPICVDVCPLYTNFDSI
jgi:hypothetical protein